MTKTKIFAALVATALGLTLAAEPLTAQIPKKERKAAAAMLKGKTLYMLTDAPCTQGRHAYGVYQSPVVDISPKGVNLQADEGVSFSWFHAGSTVWEVRVNDAVELDELDWEDDTVEIELEGVDDSDGRDTTIRFVDIHSLDDFKAAFDHTFSDRPLQDKHPDWPQEIRDAIADRQLSEGMNKRQAYYVVGTPARVSKEEKDGMKIETWTLRTGGVRIGFWGARAVDPGAVGEELRFEDGKLATAPVTGVGGTGLDLDNP